jgi:hypothetical protein
MEHRTPIRILNNPTLDRKLQKAVSRLKDVVLDRGTARERIVLEYGRPFIGIARPRGYRRQWMVKQCFRNAGILADEGRGTYCEGFVLGPPDFLFPIHHAWITLDGKTAIDVTLPNASECWYFGIPFSGPAFARLHTALVIEQRVWPTYLGLPMDERVIAALKEMRAGGLL